MKNLLTLVLSLILMSLSAFSQWKATDHIYHHKLDNNSFIFEEAGIYFTSIPNDTIYVIKPDATLKYLMPEMDGYITSSILVDMDTLGGKYYFASAWGLFEYDPHNQKWKIFTEYNSKLPNSRLHSIKSANGQLIIVSDHAGITVLKDNDFRTIPIGNNSEIMPRIYGSLNISFYKSTYYYFSLSGNLCRMRNDSLEVVINSKDIYENEEAIEATLAYGFVEHNNLLYFITQENKMYSFDGTDIYPVEDVNIFLETRDSLEVASFRFNKKNEPVIQFRKFDLGKVRYGYLSKKAGEVFELFDFYKELNIEHLVFNLEQNQNGDIFFSSGFQLITDGDLPTSVEETEEINISIFPNPAKQEFTLEFASKNHQTGKIYISDVLGNEVALLHEGYINEGANNFTYSLPNNISSGSYYVTLEMDGVKQTEVLKVEK